MAASGHPWKMAVAGKARSRAVRSVAVVNEHQETTA
jgi:hypothetical protein